MSFLLLFLRVLFKIMCGWTGEFILFILSLGRHKPQWGLEGDESPTLAYFFFEISVLIGMIFWIGLLIAVKLLVFK